MLDSDYVDVSELRSEVRSHYAEVADRPDGEFHFHTGRFAAEQLGYDPELLAGLPESAIEAFAGVANPFEWGIARHGRESRRYRLGGRIRRRDRGESGGSTKERWSASI